MELILMRHGKPESVTDKGDFYRLLVEKGRDQARRSARLLKGAGCLPEIVLTSPFLRARETAELFCEEAGLPGPVIQGWLASGIYPEMALNELAAFRDFNRVAIVGHEPDLSRLLSWTLGTNGGGIEIKRGGIACVEVKPPSRHGALIYLIPPKLADPED
jgi:phosphohistidine phosphatase